MDQRRIILSIDGGGVRGISALKILESIMEQIRDEDHLKDVPLPHQYFDLMGGTSTGGIIAIMLGRLRMPVDACIRAYTALAKEAFVPKHPYLPTLPGHPKGQFFATNLENAIKKVIKEQRGECSEHCKNKDGNSESCSHADMPFRDIDCTKTAVLAVTKVNVEAAPTLFKTYDTSTTFRDCTIWEVARATSAATSFFKSIKCGRDEIEFIDAAFGHNNPCEILIKEARRVFPDATKFQILSIGTGMGKVIDIKDSRKSILRALKEMTTSSKHVADRVADAYAVDEDYFRFNVDRGLEDVTLAEWDEKSTISGHTHNYLEKEGDRMLKCAQMLSKHRKNATVEKGSTPQAETDSKETAVSVQVDRVQTAFEKNLVTNLRRNKVRRCKIFDVPLDSNRNYVPRPHLEDQLQNLLKPHDQDSRLSNRVALWGLGGSGKTEIAVRFCEKHRECYTEIFWVHGNDHRQLLDGFSEIARKVGQGHGAKSEGSKELALQWLSEYEGWLLVIDNVDDDTAIDALQGKFLRAGMNGSVIITSRNQTAKNKWHSIEVAGMRPEEAARLMENIIGPSVSKNSSIPHLAEDLGYLALAVDQAASYISAMAITVEEYQLLLATKRSHLLSHHPSTPYNIDNRQTVLTTWQISYDQIGIQVPQANMLLLLLSLLNHEDIPLEILRSCFEGQNYWAEDGNFKPAPLSECWIPQCLSTVLSSEVNLLEAIGSLMKFSLVRKGTNQTIYLHPLVHHWAFEKLSKDRERESKFTICIIGMISSVFEKQDQLPPLTSRTYGSRGLEDTDLPLWPWRRYPRLVPHALRCLQHPLRISVMPQSIVVRTLSLLQVLEYSTFGDLAMDQKISVSLIQKVQEGLERHYDGFLKVCALMWRLTRAELCVCHKSSHPFDHINLDDRMQPLKRLDKVYSIIMCNTCADVYEQIEPFCIRAEEESPRTKALMRSLKSRIQWDKRLHSYEIAPRDFEPETTQCETSEKRHGAGIRRQDVASFGQSHEIFQQRGLGSLRSVSWMEQYGSSMTNYMLLRSQGEYHYRHVSARPYHRRDLRQNSKGKQRPDDSDCCAVWHHFKDLCGEFSEECRRSAFYESSSMISLGAWDEAEHCLKRLVLDSIKHPVQSWSHERCIVRYVEALSKQGRHEDAGKILQKAHESYEASGKQLKAGANSPLLQNILQQQPPAKKMQIFVKELKGTTATIQTNACATVRSIMDAYEGRFNHKGAGALRYIYGSKQLEADRFLLDYNIQNEATIHVVLRLYGGKYVVSR